MAAYIKGDLLCTIVNRAVYITHPTVLQQYDIFIRVYNCIFEGPLIFSFFGHHDFSYICYILRDLW